MFLLFYVLCGTVSYYLIFFIFYFFTFYLLFTIFYILLIFSQIFVGSWLSVQIYSCWHKLVTLPRGIIPPYEERYYISGNE